MENTEQAMVVCKDQAGDYYVLPQELLERAPVSAEAKAALDAHLPALRALGTGEDTHGHVVAFIAGAALGSAAVLMGFSIGRGDPLYAVIQRALAQ
ncbi:MAG: hypothetical protein ACRDJE_05660 [Dehalococcoidia bacterium]